MVKRTRVGIIFTNNENWIGGTYYILNLISALNTIKDTEKPTIIIFSDNLQEKDKNIVLSTQYPYIEFIALSFRYNVLEKILNKISRVLFRKNLIIKQHHKNIVDVVFPYNLEIQLDKIQKKICWIPDFQEFYLKDFFNDGILKIRKNQHNEIIKRNLTIIFSSQEAQNNFKEIYPEAKNKTLVLNFAVTHPEYNHLNINDLIIKFGIKKNYLISPNQFWIHKNHQIVLEAVKILAEEKLDFQIIFTGKEYDFRSPNYTENLKKIVKENNLDNYIKFLGFIDRKEQLQLMNNALAIIQPSLFEGWSTVVEDAKAMNKFVILSDISVHREQIQDNVCFFNPKDKDELVTYIKKVITTTNEIKIIDYSKNIEKFALNFIEYLKIN